MAEEISSASEGGAGVETEQKVAEGTSQEDTQVQSSESTRVESGESQASSSPTQARKNYDWAAQRTLEKSIKKVLSSALDERFSQLEKKFASQSQPTEQTAPTTEIDYNDLPGSINKIVDTLLSKRESAFNKTLPELKSELLNDISTQTSRQEARKYLQSQKDIGSDTLKHEEIQDIIVNDEILYNAIDKFPVKVMQQAVERWRDSKKNPLAPGRGELSTVSGGMGAVRQGTGTNPQRIKDLTDKIISSNLSVEEREKLNAEIEKLTASFK